MYFMQIMELIANDDNIPKNIKLDVSNSEQKKQSSGAAWSRDVGPNMTQRYSIAEAEWRRHRIKAVTRRWRQHRSDPNSLPSQGGYITEYYIDLERSQLCI